VPVDRVLGRWPRSALTPQEPETDALPEQAAAVWRGIVRTAVLVIVLQSVLHLIDAAAFDLRIERLDADRDLSVWSWAGSAAELMAGSGAALLLVLTPRRWKTFGFLTLVFVFFSMDDTVQVHERLSHVLDRFPDWSWIPRRVVWPVLYAPLMLVTCALLWRMSGAMNGLCRRSARGGLVLLGIAVVLEFAVSTAIIKAGYGRTDDDTRVGGMLYEYEVVVEEALELGGWLLIAAGLIATALDVLVWQVRTGAGSLARTAGTSPGRSVGDGPRTGAPPAAGTIP